MTIVNLDADLIELCASFGIGIPQRPPQPITGGLLHRMWRLDTDHGIFAVKVLNPEIMSRPDAKMNYRNSERVAQAAYRNGIRAVPAKTVGNEPWVELNGNYIMVFDWVDGHTLLSEKCTPEHGRKMGEVLFQIHHFDVAIDGLDRPSFLTFPIDIWRIHIERARRDTSCWGFSCETLLHDVFNWSRLYQEAVENLSQQWVISHRDLDAKNVIWNKENTPYLIDWESAGYVNPTVELIEIALNWSKNQAGTWDKERFQDVVKAYLEAGGTMRDKVLDAVCGSFGGMLGWLDYNMRRSLEVDVFDMDDRELGHREVIHTVCELKKLNEVISDCVKWVEEVAG